MLPYSVHNCAYTVGRPAVHACLRTTPEDFRVYEIPLLEPSGTGEHAWLLVRKRLENTADIAARLSRLAGVSPRDVSYAGMKDRKAVTEQWFSVRVPGCDEPDWAGLDSDTTRLIRHARHSRKLRRGALRGNSFRLVLRDVAGDCEDLEQRLERVRAEGVPNYFGEQRFGRNGSNLQTALQLFKQSGMRLSRTRRGLALSAARSLLFNEVLSQRVADGSWNRGLPGDALQLQGSRSFFIAEQIDAELAQRISQQDVHPTGPLHGRGTSPVQAACLQLETQALAEHSEWTAGLEAAGLKQERRALRVTVEGITWSWTSDSVLEVTFSLPPGSYATSVVRELVQYAGQELA